LTNTIKQLAHKAIYYLPSPVRYRIKKTYSALKNFRFRRAYYCKALSGESNYNICINSDLTVSCNCGDYDASGHIGDLSKASLEEIFAGKTAQGFRNQLATGNIPIPSCSGCVELQPTTREKAKEKSKHWELPKKGIMVENTVVCNYKCLACDRGVVDTRQRTNGRSGGRLMSLEDIEIVAKTIQTYGIEQVCYFNLGEPFLSRDILKEMQIIRKYNPDTTLIVSTNGIFIEGENKTQAAMMFDEIYFSIDGSSQEAVEKYQVGGNFEKSIKNMKQLVKHRDEQQLAKPLIEWKYVVFEWNDSEDEINRAISLAEDANVDRISFLRGGMPGGKGVSRRYDVSSFFRQIGDASWKGRELIFRTPVEK
jgi:uncharacterized Fe-S cluster-containing radical SAM superfamily protein